MARVQIPAYTDRWMMGDRFGTIVKTVRIAPRTMGRTMLAAMREIDGTVEIAHVKLDKSGKIIRVILADCRGA